MIELSRVISLQEFLDILNFTYKLEVGKNLLCLDFEHPPSPDCIYHTKEGSVIGIEHTSLIIENHPKMGDAQRVIQNNSNKILDQIRLECRRRQYNSVDLVISFDYQMLKLLASLKEITLKVLDYLDAFILSGSNAVSHWPKSIKGLFPGVVRISLNRNEGSKYVRVIHSHWNSDIIDLEPLIIDGCMRKKDKIEKYRMRCESLWLLLVHPEPMFCPMTDLNPDFTLTKDGAGDWDQIYLYNRINQSFKTLLSQ